MHASKLIMSQFEFTAAFCINYSLNCLSPKIIILPEERGSKLVRDNSSIANTYLRFLSFISFFLIFSFCLAGGRRVCTGTLAVEILKHAGYVAKFVSQKLLPYEKINVFVASYFPL